MNKSGAEIIGTFIGCLLALAVYVGVVFAALIMLSRVFELEFNQEAAVWFSITAGAYKLIMKKKD